MSEWDFAWGLTGQALIDALASGFGPEKIRLITVRTKMNMLKYIIPVQDVAEIIRKIFTYQVRAALIVVNLLIFRIKRIK